MKEDPILHLKISTLIYKAVKHGQTRMAAFYTDFLTHSSQVYKPQWTPVEEGRERGGTKASSYCLQSVS